MINKIIVFMFCLLVCISATSCSIETNQESLDIINQEDDEINFDTSKYIAHGTVYCGRLWVERSTEGNWDESSELEFAYFDTNGKQITGWFDSESTRKSNYVNNILIICGEDLYYCYAYDINGKKLGEFSIVGEKERYVAPRIADSTNQNQRIIETREGMFLIDEKGMHKFDCEKTSLYISGNFSEGESEDGYIVENEDEEDDIEKYGCKGPSLQESYTEFEIYPGNELSIIKIYENDVYNDEKYYYAFDHNYKLVFCINSLFDNNGIEEVSITSDDRIKVKFTGLNYKSYSCVLNKDGQFDKKPFLDE